VQVHLETFFLPDKKSD